LLLPLVLQLLLLLSMTTAGGSAAAAVARPGVSSGSGSSGSRAHWLWLNVGQDAFDVWILLSGIHNTHGFQKLLQQWEESSGAEKKIVQGIVVPEWE
jgi:hypothetical protein